MNIQKKIVNPKIAVIPGDGIGKEVMPEGVRALESAARKFGIQFQFDHFDFASCDYYQKHGKMMPDNWFDTLMKYDSIFFGAVGMPNILPDHLSLWGSLIQFPVALTNTLIYGQSVYYQEYHAHSLIANRAILISL